MSVPLAPIPISRAWPTWPEKPPATAQINPHDPVVRAIQQGGGGIWSFQGGFPDELIWTYTNKPTLTGNNVVIDHQGLRPGQNGHLWLNNTGLDHPTKLSLPVTCEVWVTINSHPNQIDLFSLDIFSSSYYGLCMQVTGNGQVWWHVGGGGAATQQNRRSVNSPAGSMPLGVPTQLIGIFLENTNLPEIWINGTLPTQTRTGGATSLVYTGTESGWMGRRTAGSADLDGVIHSVRLIPGIWRPSDLPPMSETFLIPQKIQPMSGLPTRHSSYFFDRYILSRRVA